MQKRRRRRERDGYIGQGLEFLIGMNTDDERSGSIEDFNQIEWKHGNKGITKREYFQGRGGVKSRQTNISVGREEIPLLCKLQLISSSFVRRREF